MRRIKPPLLSAAVVVSALSLLCAPHPADASTSPILRLRGGPSWEDNNSYTGPAWFAGASVGAEINRSTLVTLGADRIDLDDFRVATPVMVNVDVGRRFRDGVRPSLVAGVGPWYLQIVRTVDVDFFGGPPSGARHGDSRRPCRVSCSPRSRRRRAGRSWSRRRRHRRRSTQSSTSTSRRPTPSGCSTTRS